MTASTGVNPAEATPVGAPRAPGRAVPGRGAYNGQLQGHELTPGATTAKIVRAAILPTGDMGPLQYLEFVAGLAVLAGIFGDLFQTVVLPRPSVYRTVLASRTVVRSLWRLWRLAGRPRRSQDRRENFLATFGPASLLFLLGFWGVSLVIGYGLLINALHQQFQPDLKDLWPAIRFSAYTLLPLSYGNVVPTAPLAQIVTIAESATGVILIALVITLIFTLYQSFQRREQLVVTLDALAGAPPSGLQLLETAGADAMMHRLEDTFDEWRNWAAAVLESHLAYPILFFFRSSHDNEAWLNSFVAVMDAAIFVLSTVDHESVGVARLMLKIGNHLVEDSAWYFRLRPDGEPGVTREQFDEAHSRLVDAGYECRAADDAWPDFIALRSAYAPTTQQLVQMLAITPAPWLGERTYLPHRAPGRRSQLARAGRQTRQAR